MTLIELKRRIRAGEATGDISQSLFEQAYEEVLKEDHPGARLATLIESRWTRRPPGQLPAGIHERVALMVEAAKVGGQSPRSEVKSQSYDPLDHALAIAVDHYKNRPTVAKAVDARRTPPPPKGTLLRESWDDLKKKYPTATATERAIILMNS